MHNALHEKDDLEQKPIKQDHRAKCLNFNVSRLKFQKDEVSLSLERQPKNSFKALKIPLKKTLVTEQKMHSESQKTAYDLYQEVYGDASNHAEDEKSSVLGMV